MPSSEPLYSVVVPSHNRRDTLPEVLDALEAQRDAPPYEVVVVDDGSTDGVREWLRSSYRPANGRVLEQENRGPAAARNRGVEAARGTYVAFLGDDTVPSAGWLAEHHRRRRELGEEVAPPVAVIGYTGWHHRMRLNPFLRYINEYGLQFGYGLIDDPEDVPFNFLYTSNLSLRRDLLLMEPFDLSFPYAAWEDIELSYRLTRRRGLRLVYAPQATTEHLHPTTIGRYAVRQEKAGYCAVVFYRRHPELGSFLGIGPEGPPPMPDRRRQRWRELLARTLQWTPFDLPETWEEILRYHYIAGLHRGWREEAGIEKGGCDVRATTTTGPPDS